MDGADQFSVVRRWGPRLASPSTTKASPEGPDCKNINALKVPTTVPNGCAVLLRPSCAVSLYIYFALGRLPAGPSTAFFLRLASAAFVASATIRWASCARFLLSRRLIFLLASSSLLPPLHSSCLRYCLGTYCRICYYCMLVILQGALVCLRTANGQSLVSSHLPTFSLPALPCPALPSPLRLPLLVVYWCCYCYGV